MSVEVEIRNLSSTIKQLRSEVNELKWNLEKRMEDGRRAITLSGITIPPEMDDFHLFSFVVSELMKKVKVQP